MRAVVIHAPKDLRIDNYPDTEPGPGEVRRSATCLYTNTPDEHFALGPLPEDPRIVVASACSGHGFKFLPASGEAVAAFAAGEAPPVDVSSFAVDRLL